MIVYTVYKLFSYTFWKYVIKTDVSYKGELILRYVREDIGFYEISDHFLRF